MSGLVKFGICLFAYLCFIAVSVIGFLYDWSVFWSGSCLIFAAIITMISYHRWIEKHESRKK